MQEDCLVLIIEIVITTTYKTACYVLPYYQHCVLPTGPNCTADDESYRTLKGIVDSRPFSFDCYDFFTTVSSGPTHDQVVADCVRSVVQRVQQGDKYSEIYSCV